MLPLGVNWPNVEVKRLHSPCLKQHSLGKHLPRRNVTARAEFPSFLCRDVRVS